MQLPLSEVYQSVKRNIDVYAWSVKWFQVRIYSVADMSGYGLVCFVAPAGILQSWNHRCPKTLMLLHTSGPGSAASSMQGAGLVIAALLGPAGSRPGEVGEAASFYG